MTHLTAELDLVVGSLFTVREQANRKVFREEAAMLAQVQQQLETADVRYDFFCEPGTVVWTGDIETLDALYQLCRLAVRLERNEDVTNVLADGPVLTDNVDSEITMVWDGKRSTTFPHLIHLQGINSYFLPIPFPAPLWLPFVNAEKQPHEAYFASSVQLHEELLRLQPMLARLVLVPDAPAMQCFTTLLTASTFSIQARLPLIVW